MRILFVADGRSSIARGWISSVQALGHEVHLVSTYPCDPWPELASFALVPVAFSGLKRGAAGSGGGIGDARQRAQLRRWVGSLTVPLAARRLRTALAEVSPDLVHALRVPFEGMLAAWARPAPPLVVSIWGNDFTLHAPDTPLMGWLTRRTMAAAAGVHADCQRDVRLAHRWGLGEEKPTVVLPGNGGVAPPFLAQAPANKLQPGSRVSALLADLGEGQPLVCNPRGLRAYVRTDTFFKSIPLVLAERPDVHFACPTMAGQPQAESWVARLSIEGSVSLLGRLDAVELAGLFARSQLMISPSEHDGTPNSLLEAMACGAFPIVGDLESLREWIADGENGLLIEPSDPAALAKAILAALADPAWRQRAAAENRRLIERRAARPKVQEQAERFYQTLAAGGGT